MSNGSTRRGFLKGAAIAAGAVGVSRIPGVSLVGEAEAAVGSEAPAICIINLIGGYNTLFCAPKAFVGTAWSVTSTTNSWPSLIGIPPSRKKEWPTCLSRPTPLAMRVLS